ncbi:MAG: nitroreductase family protein [Candidatus Methanofastidiosia archaeon]|jgi:nitroreductase
MSKKAIDLIRKRRSIRHFKTDFVRPEAIKVVLDAARWAPSSNNSQPWEFVVVSEKEEKVPMAELYVDAYRKEAEDLLFREDAEDFFDNPYKVKKRILNMLDMLRHQLLDPPYIIVVCVDPEKSRSYLLESGAAIQNMMLTAWDLKLGSCCIELVTTLVSEYYEMDKLKMLLGIPENIVVVALVPIGKIDKMPVKPERQILKDFHHTEFW